MKNLAAAALLLLAQASAAGTDYFTGSTEVNVANDASGQTTYLMWENTNGATTASEDNYVWKIITQTFYEVDTGYRWLRVTHVLNANIAADDVVTFDLSFTSSYDNWIDPKNDMIEDSGRCTVQQNADDTRFWTTSVTDYYWQCDEVDCTNSGSSIWRSGSYSATADTVNDWVVAVEDDDPEDRFCTPVAPVTTAATPTEQNYRDLEAEAFYAC